MHTTDDGRERRIEAAGDESVEDTCSVVIFRVSGMLQKGNAVKPSLPEHRKFKYGRHFQDVSWGKGWQGCNDVYCLYDVAVAVRNSVSSFMKRPLIGVAYVRH